MKKKIHFETVAWVVVVLIAISPACYSLLIPLTEGFWDNMFGNLLATLLALIAGIPIGLWVDRYIKQAEEVKRIEFYRKREIEILKLIKEELSFCLNSIFIPHRKGKLDTLPIQPYKSDLWDSLVASEEIKYIDSPDVLHRIASAYYRIKLVRHIETEAYIASRTSAIQFIGSGEKSENAAQVLTRDARRFDQSLEDSISNAITDIENRISQIEAANSYEKDDLLE